MDKCKATVSSKQSEENGEEKKMKVKDFHPMFCSYHFSLWDGTSI